MIFRKTILLLSLLSSLFLFNACETTSSTSTTGELEMKITDAPSDDASVEGVFVTVVDVKVDGKSYSGFEGRQTIDVMAYQNGQTKILGLAELEAGSYSNVTLVLDTETDDKGETPGCYVKKTDGEKDDLAASGQSTLEITSQSSFSIAEDVTSSIVLDFDLRKSVKYDDSNPSEKSFSFVSQSELNASVRSIDEDNSGSLEGSFETSLLVNPEKVVVYIYEKGSFNKDTEVQAQGSSNIQFKNAVSSAVAVNGSYKLSFLEEGDYEVCMVSYEDPDNDGEFTFEGFLNASVFLNGSVTSEVSISAGLTAGLDLNIIGILK